jgi:hypothetical protein
MDDRFDQLVKGVAAAVSRRQAVKRFGFGLFALALPGFAPSTSARNCLSSGSPCGRPGQGGCGSCCSKSHFCEISADTGRQCFCN